MIALFPLMSFIGNFCRSVFLPLDVARLVFSVELMVPGRNKNLSIMLCPAEERIDGSLREMILAAAASAATSPHCSCVDSLTQKQEQLSSSRSCDCVSNQELQDFLLHAGSSAMAHGGDPCQMYETYLKLGGQRLLEQKSFPNSDFYRQVSEERLKSRGSLGRG